jgi:heme exporter protein B
MLVAFRFALPAEQAAAAADGLLWVAIVFTALVGLARAFVPEHEQRVLDALVLAPCDRSAIWLGKVFATFAFLVIVEAIAVPLFAVFFTPIDAAAVAAILLADVGLCAVGTLLAAMAVAGRAREVLLPLLLLPLAIPIVVGGVGATVVEDPARYLGFLGLYDAIFAILAWATFEYVITE